MEKLDKAYDAIEMLESLGLPVSIEQLHAVSQMEKDYLRDEIILKTLPDQVEIMRQQAFHDLGIRIGCD